MFKKGVILGEGGVDSGRVFYRCLKGGINWEVGVYSGRVIYSF